MSKKNKFIQNFKAVVLRKKDNKFSLQIEKAQISQLNKEEVVIKVEYTSLNYKDLLVCSGNPGLVRKFPHIPGIDASGIIASSQSKKFKVGDKVVIIAKPLGVKSPGGFAEYVKASSSWVEKLPSKISTKTAMIYGTAGFTAAYAIILLLRYGLKRSKMPVLVTGANGGVGTLSILFLKELGFNICASTRRMEKKEYLKKIGSNEVVPTEEVNQMTEMPLLGKKFSAVIDNIGGNIISTSSKQLIENGLIASIGNVSGEKTFLNLLPLILRGIKILGVNSESISISDRKKVWKYLVNFSKNKKLKIISSEHKFDEIINLISRSKNYNLVGRNIISLKC